MTNKLLIHEVSWQEAQSTLKALRTGVFVDEQGVPLDMELDGKDELPSTRHFMGEFEGEVVAVGRLLDNGKIERICVAQPFRRQGKATELLKFIVLEALSGGAYPELSLHAQVNARPLYEKCGFLPEGDEFIEVEIPHIAMRFNRHSQDALDAVYGHSIVRLDHPQSFTHHFQQMLHAGQRQVHIFCHGLDSLIYTQALTDSLSAFARGHRQSRIQVLLQDTRALVGATNPIVNLAQRLPTSMAIKKLREVPQKPDEAYMIVDRRHLVFFNDEQSYVGFASYRARPEAENRIVDFENLWHYHSEEDPNLKRLVL